MQIILGINASSQCSVILEQDQERGEMINLKIKNVKLNGNYGEIHVNGKTGMRRIPLAFSIPN